MKLVKVTLCSGRTREKSDKFYDWARNAFEFDISLADEDHLFECLKKIDEEVGVLRQFFKSQRKNLDKWEQVKKKEVQSAIKAAFDQTEMVLQTLCPNVCIEIFEFIK